MSHETASSRRDVPPLCSVSSAIWRGGGPVSDQLVGFEYCHGGGTRPAGSSVSAVGMLYKKTLSYLFQFCRHRGGFAMLKRTMTNFSRPPKFKVIDKLRLLEGHARTARQEAHCSRLSPL